jgi:hypothetical protein
VCGTWAYSCNDSYLKKHASSCSLYLTTTKIDCKVTNDNAGCARNYGCPAGKKIVGLRAGCDLEYGNVLDSQASTVPGNTLRVIRQSSVPLDARCWIDNQSTYASDRSLGHLIGRSWVATGCYEHEPTGGDCHVNGTLWCR